MYKVIGVGNGAQYAISMRKKMAVKKQSVVHALQACDCWYDIIKNIQLSAMMNEEAAMLSAAQHAWWMSGPEK